MATPLFTLAAFQAFEGMSKAFKFEMVIDGSPSDISLTNLVDMFDDEDDSEAMDKRTGVLRSALFGWQDAFPSTPCPMGLAQLICNLSSPSQPDQARSEIINWAADFGQVWVLDEESELREALISYVHHTMPALDLIQVIDDLIDINTNVKKKLLGEAPGDSRVIPWPNLLEFHFPERESVPQT